MSNETRSRRHVYLTQSEVAVIRAIMAGHTTAKDLATEMGVSTRTIQTHLGNIYKKTGAYNKADLVLIALGRKDVAIELASHVNRWSKGRGI